MSLTQVEPSAALADLQETKPERVTIVVLSGDMDRVMAAFIIATGAAAMGMPVTMFFTFWGLNAIRKPGASTTAKDLLRRMFGWLNKGGAHQLPLSRFNFGGMGARMMQKVMRDNLPVSRGRGGRPDSHSPVDLAAVGVDDFPAEPPGKLQRDCALA